MSPGATGKWTALNDPDDEKRVRTLASNSSVTSD